MSSCYDEKSCAVLIWLCLPQDSFGLKRFKNQLATLFIQLFAAHLSVMAPCTHSLTPIYPAIVLIYRTNFLYGPLLCECPPLLLPLSTIFTFAFPT